LLRSRQIGEEINRPCKGVRVWWLGDSGFGIRSGERLVLIDPVIWVEEKRRSMSELGRELIYEVPVVAGQIKEVEMVLITRGEGTHLGARTLKELGRTKCVFVCPRRWARTLSSLGIESSRMEVAEPGQAIERKRMKVIPTAARLGREQDGCGYILEIGKKRIFYPGETVVTEEMLQVGRVDVMMAPIGTRQPGIEGSARLANALEARWVVPCNYWTYRDDETRGIIDPGRLVEHVKDGKRRVKVLDQGERFEVGD